MKTTSGFNARKVRDALLARGGPNEDGFVRLTYRPFDTRWLYWEADGNLLDRPRPDYMLHIFKENLWIEAREREAKEDFSRGTLVRFLADNFGNGLSSYFPTWLCNDGFGTNLVKKGACHQNLSPMAQHYLDRLGIGIKDLFHHVLVTLHDPAYRKANAGALRMEWPRIPLPGWPHGETRNAEELVRSAQLGRELAALLDPETPVPGVTHTPLRPEIAVLGVPATTDGRNMAYTHFAVTAGWGHRGAGDAVMPGQGRIVERPYTSAERTALSDAMSVLGETTFDVHLNGEAFWCNIPAAVWNYRLGGYQVLKKWLSYREQAILGRNLLPEEVQYFADTTRRISALLMMSPSR